MNILFLSVDYPDSKSSDFPFVKQLVDEIASQGNTCVVVSPFSIINKKRTHPYKQVTTVGKGEVILIRPNIVTFSNLHIGNFYLSIFIHRLAIKNALKKLEVIPDVVYCHFWELGITGVNYAEKEGLKCFVATGESIIPKFSNKDIKKLKQKIQGVICVSSKNKDESIQAGLTIPEKCGVFPNAVNAQLFYKRDKYECRKELGIRPDIFVVCFVGWFDDRKGVKRVSDAIALLNNDSNEESVYSIFIGSGTMSPDVNNIIFKGRLPHEQIPLYLNASDVFVLPTLKEGCCNAVVEAMSCGLPIVSSNLSFNWDVLDESNSIMVDPMNIEEIKEAIIHIKNNNQKRQLLSEGSLSKAKSLTIDNRAKAIINFMRDRM